MSTHDQLVAIRVEAHRLLDALLDVGGRYYGNEDPIDRARQLNSLDVTRTAMHAVVDAYGTAIGYPETYPPHAALADEIASQRTMHRDAVVSLLSGLAERLAPATEATQSASDETYAAKQ